jgi:hypothetical protein
MGEPAVVIRYSGSFGQITWYVAEVTRVAKYTALFEPLIFTALAEKCDNTARHQFHGTKRFALRHGYD